MENIKFKDLFFPFRGANTKNIPELTEKEIYKLLRYQDKSKKVPVLSGADLNKGLFGFIPNFLSKKDLTEHNHDCYIEKNKIRYFINRNGCLTMIRCGNAGKLFYRSSSRYPIFSLTTSIFTFFKKRDSEIKKKHINFNGLNLKWFCFRFNPLFNNLVKSEGLSTIPLKLINNIILEIPKLEIQEKQLLLYEKVDELKKNIKNRLLLIKKIKDKCLKFEGDFKEEKELSYFLEHISRNDALSEEGIYKRSQNLESSKKVINILSGSFEGIHGRISFEKRIHCANMKQCLHVITRGDAGKLRYLPKGNYATNTNAMLLLLKEEIKKELEIDSEEDEKIYLKFLRYYLEPIFLKYVSSADLSVLPLTEVLNTIIIPKIKLTEKIKEIVLNYEKLEENNIKLSNSLKRIESLLQKEILFN